MNAAEAALIHDISERIAAIRETDPLVRFPEERGVGEPGPNNPFIAVAHPVRRFADEIRYRYEPGQQITTLVGNGKITLMTGERGDSDLLGQRQERLVEAADQWHGPFGQGGDFIVQGLVGNGLATRLFCRLFHSRDNGFPPHIKIGEHAGFFEQRQILCGLIDGNLARRMKAVAAGHPAGRHAHHGTLNDITAVQQYDPVHGPHELGLTIAPAHSPRYRQILESALNEPRYKRRGLLAALERAKAKPLAFVARQTIKGFGFDAALFRKRTTCGRDFSGVVVGDRDRRALYDNFLVGLRKAKRRDNDSKPAWARVCGY